MDTTIGQSFDAPKEKTQEKAVELTEQIIADLIAGKNPMSSKTIKFNAVLFGVGLLGFGYQAYVGGNIAEMSPFLVSMTTACINTVLRFVTNGPLITNGLNKIMDTLVTLPPPKS